MTTREMLDKLASQNYQLAAENAKLKDEKEAFRAALTECREAIPPAARKTLSAKTRETLVSVAPEAKTVRSRAAGQN